MLQVENLHKSYGDRVILEGLSLYLERGDKLGLIAPNGRGKTTLMNILVGDEPYDSGRITYETGVRWAYLPQRAEVPADAETVLDACFSKYDPAAQLALRWERATELGDTQTLEQLLPEMDALGAWAYEQRAREILGALGIHDTSRSVAHLSGGEAKRIALAAALISEPDLLYLDEPTNHLDIESIEWLERYLSRSTMSLVLITHDRYFLDRVCNQIVEIEQDGALHRYKGNYAYFLEKREERHEAEASALARKRNILRKELEWVRRQPQARGTKARYRLDAYDKLSREVQSVRREAKLELGKGEGVYIGNKIFEAKDICKAYGDKVILRHFDYTFSRGDKVGLVGANGVGKTTFLRMLLGEEAPDQGHFDVGETVRFGYYSQVMPNFATDKRVIDVVQDIAERFEVDLSGKVESLTATGLLTRFLFPPDRQYTQVGKLSGGELRRLYLCTVLASKPNFLILDEPTNDLDILTLNVLEDYLQAFSGCVLIVSHDRFFMDKVASHLICLEGEGKVRDFPGIYSHYRAYLEAQEELQAGTAVEAKSSPQPRTDARPRTEKLSYKEKRELEDIALRLSALEQEHLALEHALSAGTLAGEALYQASERIGQVVEEMDTLVLRQLELEEKNG